MHIFWPDNHTLASFPGPAQLSVACSTEKRHVWGESGNEANHTRQLCIILVAVRLSVHLCTQELESHIIQRLVGNLCIHQFSILLLSLLFSLVLSFSGVPCVQDNGGPTSIQLWQDFRRRQIAGGMDTNTIGSLSHTEITTCLHMAGHKPSHKL